MRKRTISDERWRKIISEQAASGLSIAAFCRQRGVPEASFYAWRRKLRAGISARRAGEAFVEVQLAPEPAPEQSPASSGIELHLSHGRSVRVRAGFDRRTLLELLAALEHGVGGEVSRTGANGCGRVAAGQARATALHDRACGAAAAREANP